MSRPIRHEDPRWYLLVFTVPVVLLRNITVSTTFESACIPVISALIEEQRAFSRACNTSI